MVARDVQANLRVKELKSERLTQEARCSVDRMPVTGRVEPGSAKQDDEGGTYR